MWGCVYFMLITLYDGFTDNMEGFDLFLDTLDKTVPSGHLLGVGLFGRWNGKRSGYYVVKSGNVRDIFNGFHDIDTVCVKFDPTTKALYCDMYHHDSSHSFEYRIYKGSLSKLSKLRKDSVGNISLDVLYECTYPLGFDF